MDSWETIISPVSSRNITDEIERYRSNISVRSPRVVSVSLLLRLFLGRK